jgi:hypothetical protein
LRLLFPAGRAINGVEEPVRSEVEGLGDNGVDLPIEAKPPGVAYSMPEDNDSRNKLMNAR